MQISLPHSRPPEAETLRVVPRNKRPKWFLCLPKFEKHCPISWPFSYSLDQITDFFQWGKKKKHNLLNVILHSVGWWVIGHVETNMCPCLLCLKCLHHRPPPIHTLLNSFLFILKTLLPYLLFLNLCSWVDFILLWAIIWTHCEINCRSAIIAWLKLSPL